MNKKNTIILSFLSLLIFVLVSMSNTGTFSSENEFYKALKENYNIYALPKPEKDIFFCNERVPLENSDIWERYDKELLKNAYWQSSTLLLQKRASKYFPIIEEILAKNNVPDDFKYLALIESGLENVTSPAGAKGFWQILKTTGKEFGLEINNEVDERYHLEKSTQIACDFLNKSYDKFGSWTMAAASYNMGRAGLARQVNRQKENSYYDLILNQETSRYLFRIIAVKQIIENPTKYGFNLIENDYYSHIPVNEIEVDTTISNLADFANLYQINYKILKLHNPWLRQAYLPNKSRKKYTIKIPKKGYYFSNLTNNTDSIN
jgi:hypothetical protein